MEETTLISPTDIELFMRGVHYELYNLLGAHQKEGGVHFALWAKNAAQVYLAGDFNQWQEKSLPMHRNEAGIWDIFVPGVAEGSQYKYVIETKEGHLLWKADPFAFYSQLRPETASVVANVDGYEWAPFEHNKEGPISIYEVHIGSWKKGLGYRDAAHELAKYCIDLGFTHIELMPITEYPLDASWGYQVSGYFAPTARYGTVRDFQYFVDHMHKNGIGVILDWVPSHFPTDGFSLAQFDGTPLFEYSHPLMGFHPQWNTYIFDYASPRVCNFLLASALFWFDKYHIDGLRIDAVESIIMRDFAKQDFIPNIHGGRENLEAMNFLKHLNAAVKERYPKAIMCAEDSSYHAGITHQEGLNFDYKWALGWMTDTFNFFQTPFEHRDLSRITCIFDYIFTERFIVPLSHDEVVHEKRSLLEKMPGDEGQKLAGLRMLFAWMFCSPGRPLLFMGAEIAQKGEWNFSESLDWERANHQIQKCLRDLNKIYCSGLFESDFDAGMKWEIGDYFTLRRGGYVALFNFTTNAYSVEIPEGAFTTDSPDYGGMGRAGLPPLTTIIYDEKRISKPA
ncbi:MAG: 1,4-alpha-glucan branching protein GlgB [Chlamydiia bacterium]|nr:1,4-alpha-glucan branching protein GlgB [Chlamydiia bacterium]